MKYRVNVLFSKDDHGYFVSCPELPGCMSQGTTYEEARDNIYEAIELYLETMSKEEIEESLSKEILTATLEVKVG